MPTKQITVCATCGKARCDGALWLWLSVTEDAWLPLDLLTTSSSHDPRITCTREFGAKNRKVLAGKVVGEEVELYFPNWVRPTTLRVRKIAD